MKAFPLIVFQILLPSLTLTCSKPHENKKSNDYFPNTSGSYWEYDVYDSSLVREHPNYPRNYVVKVRIVGTTTLVDGKDAIVWRYEYPWGPELNFVRIVGDTAKVFDYVYSRTVADLDYPRLAFLQPFSLNQTWDGKLLYTDTYSVTGQDDVTTTAQTFSNCFHIYHNYLGPNTELESPAEALVNTVNTQGIMGKGIALQFKKAYPNNFKSYFEASKKGELQIGKLFVTRDRNIASGEKLIINFPTKRDWRKPSEYAYIEAGLEDLLRVIETNKIKSIAIPPLGSGNGGLEWQRVKKMIDGKLSHLDIDILVYEPTKAIVDHLKTERVKLTDARALLLYVLYDLVKNGEFVSEFASEKVCYFLQRFGARKHFKLTYKPNFYGPYSGKVRYLLNALNGSYITGYSDMDKKPFEPLTLVADGYETVKNYIESSDSLNAIARDTITFLTGFYSDFALELLSSIDYIASKNKTLDREIISKELAAWSDRKRTLFSNPKYLDISIRQLTDDSRPSPIRRQKHAQVSRKIKKST